MLDFYVKTRIRFFLRDMRLLEITEVEITRDDCISKSLSYFLYTIFTRGLTGIHPYHMNEPISSCREFLGNVFILTVFWMKKSCKQPRRRKV